TSKVAGSPPRSLTSSGKKRRMRACTTSNGSPELALRDAERTCSSLSALALVVGAKASAIVQIGQADFPRRWKMRATTQRGNAAMDADLQALVDREKIRICLAQLARGEDRRNAAMITASLWKDSITDYGVFRGNFDEYLAWVVPGADAIPCTQHVLGQSHIEL